MGLGSGLGASLGFAPEVTYGTYVAPTRFLKFLSEDMKKTKDVVQGGGLSAGLLMDEGTRRAVAGESGDGSFSLNVPTKGFGLLLQHLMGTTVTPVQQGATAAYLQTHTLADNYGKMLTGQVGIPDIPGTARPYTFLGGKVKSAEFSCGVGEILNAKFEMDYRQVVESQSLVAPSYASAAAEWNFSQMAVKLGTYGAEASVSSVKKMTVNFERPLYTDAKYAGAAGLKAQPVMNGTMKVTGTIEADYVDKALFADRFAADTSTSLVWEFTGALIASTYYNTIRFILPQVFLDGDTPTVGGPEEVSGSYGFTCLFDATNLPRIEYISTDTTV